MLRPTHLCCLSLLALACGSERPTADSTTRSCESASAHFGGFTPSIEELVSATQALEGDVCIPKAEIEAALRSCAAELGATAFDVFADRGDPKGCHLSVHGAAQGDRKWIVFGGFYRSGATFDGGTTVVELTSPPRVYLDALGKDAELCPMTSSTGKLPKKLPDGWDALPAATKDFLCSGMP